MSPTVLEGDLCAKPDARFAIVASRFNHFIVDRLVEGALDALHRHGVKEEHITITRVPGAWELPWAAKKLAQGGRYAAVIALGAVIRGATPHFDYVAGQATSGLGQVMRETGVPVGFGVITADTIEQAIERAGTKAGNKGWDAAMAAFEMVNLGTVLQEQT